MRASSVPTSTASSTASGGLVRGTAVAVGDSGDAVIVQTGDRRVPVAEVQLAWPGEAPRGAIERVVLRLAAFPGFGIRELENLFGPMIEGLKYDWDEPASWYTHIDDAARNEFAAVVVQYGTGPTASVLQTITITPYDRAEVTS